MDRCVPLIVFSVFVAVVLAFSVWAAQLYFEECQAVGHSFIYCVMRF